MPKASPCQDKKRSSHDGYHKSNNSASGERCCHSKADLVCVEAQLYKLLTRLPTHERHAMLAGSFSEAQRLALERWMLSRRQLPVERGKVAAHRSRRASYRAALVPIVAPALEIAGPSAKKRRKGVGSPSPMIVSACRVESAEPTLPATKAARRRRTSSVGIPGVHRRHYGGRMWYRATVTAGPFLLHSRYDTNLDLVRMFRETLEAIRGRLLRAASLDREETWEDAFRKAVLEEPAIHGLGSAADMGLCFLGHVAARHWVGQALSTPRFTACRLEEGLHAWRRLGEARRAVYCGRGNGHTFQRHCSPNELAAAWSRLREVYLDICAEARRGGRSRAARKLQKLEERHHFHQQRAPSSSQEDMPASVVPQVMAAETSSTSNAAVHHARNSPKQSIASFQLQEGLALPQVSPESSFEPMSNTDGSVVWPAALKRCVSDISPDALSSSRVLLGRACRAERKIQALLRHWPNVVSQACS